ncbi:MAG: hypothetical protein ACJ72D_21225 [Marmoricola sp.]
MPWSPSFEGARPDPRLNPYRQRAAYLLVGDQRFGHLFIGTDHLAPVTGGRLWWRTWGEPVEYIDGHVHLEPGDLEDFFISPDKVGDEVEAWAAGRFEYRGTAYDVVWLDDQESARVRDEVFRFDAPHLH